MPHIATRIQNTSARFQKNNVYQQHNFGPWSIFPAGLWKLRNSTASSQSRYLEAHYSHCCHGLRMTRDVLMQVANLKEGVQHGQRKLNGVEKIMMVRPPVSIKLNWSLKKKISGGLVLDGAERECLLKPAKSDGEWMMVSEAVFCSQLWRKGYIRGEGKEETPL